MRWKPRSRRLRGRRGTEWAAGSHSAGEPFGLIEGSTLAVLEPPATGIEARVRAAGIGDDEESEGPARAVTGEALRPPPPVRLKAQGALGQDIAISWVRRSRLGWSWSDGGDAPIGEESEAYRIDISGAGFARSLAASSPECVYTAAQQAADGASGPIAVEVAQLGTFAASRPALITIG